MNREVELESIFATALNLAADERDAYLDEACADDGELRGRVERLLHSYRAAGEFLQQPIPGLAATIASGEFDTVDEGDGEISLDFLAPCDKPGCIGKLAQYEVIEPVGRGGMGLVLRAYDTKLNRVVAIKVMAPELAANAMAVKRFLREARAAAAVSHDHVVTIHAINDDHRPPFIVMEFVDGQSLQTKIDRAGALELKEILRIGMQTARGLAAAHQQGLVHRDIKPANILLENGVERVKITDFGVARAADDVSVTQTGQIAGTPQFMSPEQAQGQPFDARSDLFSLGSVLYAMGSGRPPFRADTAVAMLRRVCDDTPRPIREVNAEIPDWLEAIVFRLLAKNPHERFPSADEVADLLGRHLAHLQNPTTAQQPQPLSTSRKSEQPTRVSVEDELSFIATSLRVYGVIAVIWAIVATLFGALVFAVPGNYEATLFHFNAPLALATGVLSAITGVISLLGLRHVGRRDSFGWALAGNAAALLPVNPLLIFVVPWSIAALIKLRSAEVRQALAKAAEAKPGPRAQRLRPSAAKFVEAALAFIGSVALLIVAGVMIYLQTDKGTLVIESEVDNVDVTIMRPEGDTGADPRVLVVDGLSGSEVVRLKSGQYRLQLKQGPGQNGKVDLQTVQLSQNQFVLRRGEQVVVRIRRIDGKPAAGGGVVAGAVATFPEVRRFQGPAGAVKSLVWFADGVRAAAASLDGVVYVWDAETGDVKQTLRVGRPLAGLAVSPDGRYAVVGFDHGSDGAIEVWSLESGEKQGTLDAHTGRVTELHFSSDGKRLMSAGYDRVMRVWDFESRRLLREFSVSNPDSVALSSDGRLVAGRDAEDERLVRIWSAELGASLHTWNISETGLLLRAAFSSDSSRLVTGSDRGKVQVWEITEAKELLRFNAHGGPVIDMLLTPDDRLLITAGGEGKLRVWDAKSGKLLAETQSDKWRFRHLALTPGGRHLLTGGGWKWDVRSRELLTDGDFDAHLYRIPHQLLPANGKTTTPTREPEVLSP